MYVHVIKRREGVGVPAACRIWSGGVVPSC